MFLKPFYFSVFLVTYCLVFLTVFDILLQIIEYFANTDVLGMQETTRRINLDDILRSRIANTVNADTAPGLLNTFLVFSWFITSVFGVKTKSKPSKIISLGRTYLRLLCENPPLQQRAPELQQEALLVELQPVNQFTLFGLEINIPALPAAAVAAAAAAPVVIDRQIVPEFGRDRLVHTARGDELDRLCLAYSSERIFGMAVNKYIKMDIDMNVTAARVIIALRHGITHQQYPVFATAFDAGITPQQYADFDAARTAAVHEGINPQQYPAVAAAVAAAVDAGINPRQYNAAATVILAINEETQQNVIQEAAIEQASNDVKQVHGTNTISFNSGSLVFNQEIFSELITRFSHLPRGNEYILGAARYMRPIMLQICEYIERGQTLNITQYMNSIRELPYPYRPALHDISKFTMLSPYMKNMWLGHLKNKILLGENEQTIFDNMKLFVLLYKYIVSDNASIDPTNRRQDINYLTAIRALIDEHFKVCGTRRNREEAEEEVEVHAARVAGLPAAMQVANAIANPPANRPAKKPRQGGGTIRFRNLSSPKKTNNHTRRNKNKRKKNSKSKTKTKFKTKSSPKHRKAIPSSRSGSKSNRKKSKPKKSQKNVTFKRRRTLK